MNVAVFSVKGCSLILGAYCRACYIKGLAMITVLLKSCAILASFVIKRILAQQWASSLFRHDHAERFGSRGRPFSNGCGQFYFGIPLPLRGRLTAPSADITEGREDFHVI